MEVTGVQFDHMSTTDYSLITWAIRATVWSHEHNRLQSDHMSRTGYSLITWAQRATVWSHEHNRLQTLRCMFDCSKHNKDKLFCSYLVIRRTEQDCRLWTPCRSAQTSKPNFIYAHNKHLRLFLKTQNCSTELRAHLSQQIYSISDHTYGR